MEPKYYVKQYRGLIKELNITTMEDIDADPAPWVYAEHISPSGVYGEITHEPQEVAILGIFDTREEAHDFLKASCRKYETSPKVHYIFRSEKEIDADCTVLSLEIEQEQRWGEGTYFLPLEYEAKETDRLLRLPFEWDYKESWKYAKKHSI